MVYLHYKELGMEPNLDLYPDIPGTKRPSAFTSKDYQFQVPISRNTANPRLSLDAQQTMVQARPTAIQQVPQPSMFDMEAQQPTQQAPQQAYPPVNTSPITDSPDDPRYMQMINTMQQIENPQNVKGKNANGYEGDFQFRYRDENDAGTKYAKQMGVTPDQVRASPKLQLDMMKRYVKDNRTALTRNGYNATPFNTYMAHNQGATGARYILNDKGVALTPTIRRNMMNQNKSIRGNDAQLRSSYIKYMQGKYNLAERQRGYNETRW